MEFLDWIGNNWVDLAQTAAIIGGFVTINRDKKRVKVQNRLYFTQRHAQLSRRELIDPKLWRVKKADVDLVKAPVTEHEDSFVRERFNNFAGTFYASKNGVFDQPEALADDIRTYFALPIPKDVWERAKKFQDQDFVEFVESHLRPTATPSA